MTETCPKCQAEVEEATIDKIREQYPQLSEGEIQVRAENMNEFFCPNCGYHWLID